MFSDIVRELRHAVDADTHPWDQTLYVRAADLLRDAQAEIERLTKERNGWQATAAGLSQDISNAEDGIERLTAELADERSECMEQVKLVVMFADRWEREKRLADQLAEAVNDLFVLLPPDRVRLIRPTSRIALAAYEEARRER